MDFYLDKTACLAGNCKLGKFSVLGAGVNLGINVQVGSGVIIYPGVEIGDGSLVGDGAILGQQPRPGKLSSLSYENEFIPLKIGKRVKIGSQAIIYAGTVLEDDVTVGDLASIRENCYLETACLVGRQAVLENDVRIGRETKIQTGAYLTAYSRLESQVFIAPLVITTNDNYLGRTEERKEKIKGVTVRRGARIGAGVLILPGVEIGSESFVAAGSLVTKNTAPATLYLGRPARPIRAVPQEEMLFEEVRLDSDSVD